jgi:hypothetical protein
MSEGAKLRVHIREGVTDYHELEYSDITCEGVWCNEDACPASKREMAGPCLICSEVFINLSEKERALFILELCEKAEWVMEGEE